MHLHEPCLPSQQHGNLCERSLACPQFSAYVTIISSFQYLPHMSVDHSSCQTPHWRTWLGLPATVCEPNTKKSQASSFWAYCDGLHGKEVVCAHMEPSSTTLMFR